MQLEVGVEMIVCIFLQSAVTSKYRIGLRLMGEVRPNKLFVHISPAFEASLILPHPHPHTRTHPLTHPLTQLVLAGVINEDLGLSLLTDMLIAIMKADSKGHSFLAVVVSFARHCAEDLAGIVPRKQRLLLTKYGIEPPISRVCIHVYIY